MTPTLTIRPASYTRRRGCARRATPSRTRLTAPARSRWVRPDLHDHQRRQRAGAAPAQDRDERQRWHGHGRRLHADRDGTGVERPVGHQPGRFRRRSGGGHVRAVRDERLPATRPAPGSASVDRRIGRNITVASRRECDLHDHQRRHRAELHLRKSSSTTTAAPSRGRLHADRQWHRCERPVGEQPGDSRRPQADTCALSERTSRRLLRPVPGSASAAPRMASNITVASAVRATCTITNNDIAPSCTCARSWSTTTAARRGADFTLTADGPATTTCRAPARSTAAPACRPTRMHCPRAGPTGYTASAWVCVGGTQNWQQHHRGARRECDLHHHQRRHRARACTCARSS